MAMTVLFPTCPLPGCQSLVEDPRDPCGECQTAFGNQLRDSGREAPPAEVFAAEMAGRDEAVRAVLAERRQPAGPGPEHKRNQTCWVCEERRTCRRDPDHPERWICRTCLDLA